MMGIEQDAHNTRRTLQQALAQILRLLKSNKTSDAHKVAQTAKILAEVEAQMRMQVQQEQDRQVRLAEAQGQLIAGVLQTVFAAVGLALTNEVRTLMREVLGRAEEVPFTVSPEIAEPVRRSLREHFAAQAAEHEDEQLDALPALPPPDDDVVEVEPDEVEVPAPVTEPEPQPADAQVVDASEPPAWLREQWRKEGLRRSMGGGRGREMAPLFRSPKGFDT